MSLKGGLTVKELLTERGSAGIEMVLWSFMVIVFIMMPLICFLFELYIYGLHGLRWGTGVENALDALEWQLQTPALSVVERRMSPESLTTALNSHLNQLRIAETGEVYQIEQLELVGTDPPTLHFRLKVSYEPSTMIGECMATAGRIEMLIEKERELPCDQ